MTRILKVSLSIVALLLVSLLVFTGCNGKSNDEALTAANEAKEAVAAATADFEKAIAEKADAAKLTSEIDKLTKAIESAEYAAADGDVALKSAIAAAKTSLTENTQAVVNALDVKIAELLDKKADGAVVDAELARFEKILENINNATGNYLKISDFNSLTSLVAESAYSLEKQFERMCDIKITYDADEWANIEKAYAIAKVSLYRATGVGSINDAFDQFEKAVKENPNEADEIYYVRLSKYEYNNTLTLNGNEKAVTNYKVASRLYRASASNVKDIIADYYGKGNLVLVALDMWRAELESDMASIGALYITPDDRAYVEALRAEMTEFADAVAQCSEWFGDVAELTVSNAFLSNAERSDALENAKADADYVIALGEAYPAEEPFNQVKVDALVEWKTAYEAWIRAYLPELQSYQQNDEAAKARYESVKALITPTVASLEAAVDAFDKDAAAYIAGANTAFVNDIKAIFYTDAAFDHSKVNLLSIGAIDAINAKVAAWLENTEVLVLPSYLYNEGDVKVDLAYAAISEIEAVYGGILATFTEVYQTNIVNVTEEHLNIYNTSAKAILDAFGQLDWADMTAILLSDGVTEFTKEAYDKLVALESERLSFIELAKAHNAKIEEAEAELLAAQTHAEFNEAMNKIQALVESYYNGSYAGEGLEDYCKYDDLAENEEGVAIDLDVEAVMLNEIYVIANDAYALVKNYNEGIDIANPAVEDKDAYALAIDEAEVALADYVEAAGEAVNGDFVAAVEAEIEIARGYLALMQ